MSLRPSTERLYRAVIPSGSLGIGFEEKSTTCRAWHPLMFSGISGISAIETDHVGEGRDGVDIMFGVMHS